MKQPYMKNIHDPKVLNEFLERIEKLTPGSHRQWGKMNVAQMMAHCATAIESNLGDRPYSRTFMGRIFGKLAKKSVTNDKPFKPGLPTDPGFVIKDDKNFEAEKQRLISALKRVSASDPEKIAANPHPFFGRMTPGEWNALNYKHMDHHLRQFGA